MQTSLHRNSVRSANTSTVHRSHIYLFVIGRSVASTYSPYNIYCIQQRLGVDLRFQMFSHAGCQTLALSLYSWLSTYTLCIDPQRPKSEKYRATKRYMDPGPFLLLSDLPRSSHQHGRRSARRATPTRRRERSGASGSGCGQVRGFVLHVSGKGRR